MFFVWKAMLNDSTYYYNLSAFFCKLQLVLKVKPCVVDLFPRVPAPRVSTVPLPYNESRTLFYPNISRDFQIWHFCSGVQSQHEMVTTEQDRPVPFIYEITFIENDAGSPPVRNPC